MAKKTTKQSSCKKSNGTTGDSKQFKSSLETGGPFSTVILFLLGILLLTMIFIKGEKLWFMFHQLFRGLFGLVLLVLPVTLIYLGIGGAKKKLKSSLRSQLWKSLLMILLLSGLVQLVFVGEYVGGSMGNTIHNLYLDGMGLRGGGVVSMIFGMPLLFFLGRAGAMVVLLLFSIALFMLVTGTTLLEAFLMIKKPTKAIGEHYASKRDQRKVPFDIDVDLGPDVLPEHPVSSSKKHFETSSNQTMNRRFMDIIKQTNKVNEPEKSALSTTTNKIQPNQEMEVEEKPQEIPLKEVDQENNDFIAVVDQPHASIQTTEKKDTPLEALLQKISQPKRSTAFTPALDQPKRSMLQNHYQYPPVSLLRMPENKINKDLSEELRVNAERLVNTLQSFGVQTRVVDISRGPTVTRYELQPSAGVKISRITGLSDDIALNLATAGVRIEAPIPNKAAVGIEVPNKETDIVTIREIIDSPSFSQAKSRLSVALGRDISGCEVVFDIAKMPHMLIAGATGSGKSVCINTLIMSLIFNSSPEEVRLLMVDPKVVELGIYNGIPHLLVPVVTDPRKAAGALGWAVTEMLKRYKLFADNQVRDLAGYNEFVKKQESMDPLPQIVLIIDELADLMMAAPNEVEDAICRLAQMARAAGMHLVIATQRPSVDVITGVIKANIPSRIAFSVSSQVDSRTIIDSSGAEKLLGRGDMLFYPVGAPKPIRLQCCYVSDSEVESIVQFIKNNVPPLEYDDEIINEIEKQAAQEKGKGKQKQQQDLNQIDEEDPLFEQAVECILDAKQASTSYLQRRLKVGYARAARLMDYLEDQGIIGSSEGSKPRQLLITKEMWIQRKLNTLDQQQDV